MNITEPEFILSANSIAMALYRESKEALLASNCHDFMVFRCSDRNVILEEWEESITIDESTYLVLHGNLCTKLKALFDAPKPDPTLLL